MDWLKQERNLRVKAHKLIQENIVIFLELNI